MVDSQEPQQLASTKKQLITAVGLLATAVATMLFFLLLGTSHRFAFFNPISVVGIATALFFFVRGFSKGARKHE